MYTPEKENSRADTLSQQRDLAGDKVKTEATILVQNKDRSLGPSRQLNSLFKITRDIPKAQQQEVIKEYHDNPLYRHPRIQQTMELIQQNYNFKGIKEAITAYIHKYTEYQQNKHATHIKYREIQVIELPNAP